jgi:hypothetical protein
MSATPTFTPAVLGQTEKALNAILDRQLAGTVLTEPLWIALSLTVATGGIVDRDELVGRVAGGLKVSEAEAQSLIGELSAARLVQAADGEGAPVKLTDSGQLLHDQIRAAVIPITERMWGDLPPDDLATAGRVLSTILERANAELAGV